MSSLLLQSLHNVHQQLRNMAKHLSDDEYRHQYHVDLSPLGWHIGHCAFIESYWLRDVVLNDDSMTTELEWLYVPENILKPKRGPALPSMTQHLSWCQRIAEENALLFSNVSSSFKSHPLNKNNYLLNFIIQHHSQHLETLAMVLAQRELVIESPFVVEQPLSANNEISVSFTKHLGGHYQIGNPSLAEAFDNEVPPHEVSIAPFALANTPVCNADWLTFINEGGYQNKTYWTKSGWTWCQQAPCLYPESWKKNKAGYYYEATASGSKVLLANAAVSGINYFEANAYISWLKNYSTEYSTVRLPHEYEWEAANNTGILNIYQVWEWCQNSFYPYDGFKAFPYDNYSQPWFDGNHFSLRGGSQYTQPSIRRRSFRNFYNPDKRHIFSGMRLALSID